MVPAKFILKDKVLEIEFLATFFISAEILHQNMKQVSSTSSHLENLVVADSSSKSNNNIDILNEREHYYRFMFGNATRGKANEAIAIEVVFGWVLNGYYESIFSSNNFIKTHLMWINTEVCNILTEDTNFNSNIV